MTLIRYGVLAALSACLLGCADQATAQVSLSGSDLVMQSNNSATLDGPGFLGTYLVVPDGGATVNFTLDATEGSGSPSAPAPHMNVVVADQKFGLSIDSASPKQYTTGNVKLPAGTYVVRAERDYVAPGSASPRSVTVNSLGVNTVFGSSATFNNVNTRTNALNAANTYIDHYRKGNVTVSFPNAAPGTQVQVSMKRNAFDFGTSVSGANQDTSRTSNAFLFDGNTNPNMPAYRAHLQENFNAIVPNNAGKWIYQEGSSGGPSSHPTMEYVNDILNYATQTGLRTRMHALMWGEPVQNPPWVNSLLNSGNVEALNAAIENRIGYYVGNPDSPLAQNPADRYFALDVLNEQVHQPAFLNTLGPQGVADVFNKVAAAASGVGADVRLFTNEYDVFLDGADAYGNWYRESIESIRDAGGEVGGVGVQYYARVNGHDPAQIIQTLQNLSVEGLPITLTEFGVKGGDAQIANAPQVLEETLRLIYGTANADGFYTWGYWQGDSFPDAFAASLYYDGKGDPSGNWTLTPVGEKWQELMAEWTTPTMDLTVGDDCTINFEGFFGDYDVMIDGKHYPLSVTRGKSDYAIPTPEPNSLGMMAVALGPFLWCVRRFRRARFGAATRGL